MAEYSANETNNYPAHDQYLGLLLISLKPSKVSQIKSLKFDVCIDYAHQLEIGSLMLYNHYASIYLYYSVMIIGLYLIVCYFGH